ncbi:MAG: HAMP domain-containing histidine kinase [Clostridia bacterium]|nr:HAMP domain-containing histidine kinase [Clostridia bacterium]
MSGEKRVGRFLYALQRFVTFFLLVAFVVTCCTMLFVSGLQKAMQLEFTEENIQLAAKVTFLNVLILTAAFVAMDALRRRHMVEKPLRRITDAANRLMQGDFSVRIPDTGSIDRMDALAEVAACFNQLAGELSGIETLRSDFVANVSHELKTPLAAIQNYAVLLQRPELPEGERQEYARAIASTARGLAGLITNILRLNKLENQQIYPEKQVFDLGEQLCRCLLCFEDSWEEKGLAITTDLAESVLISGDEELLSLVWNNLFSNAIKFTEHGGAVSLTLTAEGEMAVVRVADTGSGFGGEVGRHIFEKFYQGDPSRATRGNGLGLALVKRVVEISGGEIAVDSTVGRGSVFTVRLRRHADGEA